MAQTSWQEVAMAALRRLPTALVSRTVGRLTRLPVPPAVRRHVWPWAANRLGMNLDEAEQGAHTFASWDALFTRRLKAGLRPIEGLEGSLVSPADGVLTSLGSVPRGGQVLVKGKSSHLAQWLSADVLPWKAPFYAVVYLSPRHYHRVHSPVSGRITRVVYTPGRLLPVNPKLAGDGSTTFGDNERVTIWIEGPRGPVSVTLVGALCVGGISLVFDSLRTNSQAQRRAETRTYQSIAVEAGDELGAFHMGSTVVLGFEGRDFMSQFRAALGGEVLMGQLLGAWAQSVGASLAV